MLLMDYPSIRGGDFPDHAKNSILNLFRPYIDAHSQRTIDEYPGYGVQSISRLKSQCANMTSSDQSRYNRLFYNLIHKGGESAINYIKIFHNTKPRVISVVNSCSKDQLMHTFLDNFQQGGKYSAQIAIHQEESRGEENFVD